jgi:hypothetical protein
VITRGLSPDPHDRGSAAAFALDLRHACRPEPVRLPRAGVPDEELARTGRGPRTELTHQVPGRHRRVPEEVPPDRAGLRSRLATSGPVLRRAAVLAAVAATVALLGGWWGGAPVPEPAVLADRAAGTARAPQPAPSPSAVAPSPADPSVAAGPSAASPSDGPAPETAPAPEASAAPEPSAAPEATPAPTPPPQAAAESGEEWQVRLAELYQRRAEALTTGSVPLLDKVYVPASTLLAADRDTVSALTAAGETLRGFSPEVVSADLLDGTPGAGRVTLRVVDRWPAYEVVRAADTGGPAMRPVGERAEAEVRMTLEATAEGWRISAAERVG